MLIIIKSIPLSILVTLRMIIPIILIFIASTALSLILGIFTLGVSGLIIPPATTAFIALYGMYVALELLGKRGLIDWRVMINYSIAFGVILGLLKVIGLFAIQYLSIFAAQQSLGLNVSLHSLQTADESLQSAFTFSLISILALLSLTFLSALQATFAVPMAAAANSAFQKSHSFSLGEVFGKSFLPLFLIAVVTLFLQLFFEIFGAFAFLFGTIVFQIAVFAELVSNSLSDSGVAGLVDLFSLINPKATLIGIASILAVLWLKAWFWSAAALAFTKHEKVGTKYKTLASQPPAVTPQDLRSLRKARENNRP